MTSIKKQTFEKVDMGNILKDVADEQLLSPTFFKKGDERDGMPIVEEKTKARIVGTIKYHILEQSDRQWAVCLASYFCHQCSLPSRQHLFTAQLCYCLPSVNLPWIPIPQKCKSCVTQRYTLYSVDILVIYVGGVQISNRRFVKRNFFSKVSITAPTSRFLFTYF